MDSGCTVVLADDDDAFVTALTELLGTEPRITVLARASDGLEAVQLVQRLRPDIVLMDLQMPGTDGVAATAAIRERGLSTWVIVVSGTLSVSVGAALEAGANDFVPKMRVAEDLIDAVLAARATCEVARYVNAAATSPSRSR